MTESSQLNFDEFSESMEKMTEHLEGLAEKILPKTIHITHTGTVICSNDRVDVGLQTDVDSCALQIDVQEGGTPKVSEITFTDENVIISMPDNPLIR